MSFWDWLLAAWIYEEIFDDDSNAPPHTTTLTTMIRHTITMIIDDSLLFVLK